MRAVLGEKIKFLSFSCKFRNRKFIITTLGVYALFPLDKFIYRMEYGGPYDLHLLCFFTIIINSCIYVDLDLFHIVTFFFPLSFYTLFFLPSSPPSLFLYYLV